MSCPIETPESAELLLNYCARKLSPESTAVLERHFAICPSCRSFAEGQRAVWAALDVWETSPVSADFDRRLYERIETDARRDVPWWDVPWLNVLLRPLRLLMVHRGIAAAAAACLVITAGVLIERPGKPARPATAEMAVVDVQPEQVEQALDEMDMLSEFSRKVRAEGNPKL